MSPSPLLFFFILLLARPRVGHADADADAGVSAPCFRFAQKDFVVDLEDAVDEGAVLLAVLHARSLPECRAACCALPQCTIAHADANLTCALLDCVHRNKFVCRFVRRPGYRSVIRDAEYRKYLEGPQEGDEPAPPIAIAGRDLVVQPGATVTLDGIQSLALGDARITDYDWTLQSGGDADVVMEKTPLADQVRLSELTAGRYRLRLTVTDSNRRSDSADVRVLVLDADVSARYCLSEAKAGPCRGAFPRWRYDATARQCRQFVFGGCKGNRNNFLSEDECVQACRGVTQLQRIALPAGVNETFSRLLDLDVNQRIARCTEPPQTGPCRASHTRWYYNPLNERCQRFTYGGCHGNDNNFAEETQCDAACHGVTERDVFARGTFERFEDQDKEEESGSGSVALAVILSAAVSASLAVLGYCFLKNRSRRSGGHAEAARPAASAQDPLVYEGAADPL
ncbi:kunitz-type protease inhibitor 1-like isoform X4 [Phyllopteryx taeniolatus]|uniref:kunitz-type protease inhibitor 1-like isoform X4 n=1 Tax=Phyllopteryx taeniolatus TaxID=161469 RepID=UPI002AD35E2D|nr:kunitz-type protease inhibitor 1-like isoform X4 [Phyllopteryx taeniolatus]